MERGNLLETLEYIQKMKSLRLSSSAIEHNNNEYRQVSVYPSATELVLPNQHELSENVTKGPYSSIDKYLSTHFFLLREDFIKPIREDVVSFLRDPTQKLQNIKIHKVHFYRKGVKKGDLCHCLEITKGVTYNSWNLSMSDKRFMLGSLLIFSNDNFKTIFCGRVADNKNLPYRKVLVSFERVTSLRYNQDYDMIECNNFFEPYYHVLKVIQGVSPRNFPMTKYLIGASSSVGLPKYLNGIKYTIRDPQLNKSQLGAINGAISQELVIIQGPPGTGKTFLGLKIAKRLLSLSSKWYKKSPMLVISLTNHALDQFLEGLLDATDHILRFGDQSKNAKMMDYTIRERRKEFYETAEGKIYKSSIGPLYKDYVSLDNTFKDIGVQIDNITTSHPTCIFNFDLLMLVVPEIRTWFRNKEFGQMVSWLMEEDGSVATLSPSNSIDNYSKSFTQIYRDYIKPENKGSKYCVLSVSMMTSAIKKLNDCVKTLSQEIGLDKPRQSAPTISNIEVRKEIEVQNFNGIIEYLSSKLEYLKLCLKTEFRKSSIKDYSHCTDPFKIPVRVRWQLYRLWLDEYCTYLKDKMDLITEDYLEAFEDFNAAQDRNNLAVMRCQKVIGMTTTMAARMRSMITALACPIVIVEEAAEVLESHVISVLTEHCQHLILIGDHQQLRPKLADYYVETHYKLGVSLFERMVNNDVQCYTLDVQHRMRPEISSLITPSIYPVLHDHDSVKGRDEIRGMAKCLYFITHNELEESSGECSKKNNHEAKFLIQLAMYLLKNGYEHEEITILAAYLGQVGALTNEQQEQTDEKVKKVLITSVDNFQGEENKVILLSLVRNNVKSKIGFLSTENRVCVALSRARDGLYIMGNMEQLTKGSKLWRKINASLEAQGSVGEKLPLKCQQHDQLTKIVNPGDFDEISPTGGCKRPCNAKLKCGHNCNKQCHNDDPLHKHYVCREPCAKSMTCGHQCPKLCYRTCGKCRHRLEDLLPCGHFARCFMKKLEDYSCPEKVKVEFGCGHAVEMTCNEMNSDSDYSEMDCSKCQEDEPAGVSQKGVEDSLRKLRLG